MMVRLDNNNSNQIDFEEFLDLMTTTMILGNELTRFKNYFRNKMVSSYNPNINLMENKSDMIAKKMLSLPLAKEEL